MTLTPVNPETINTWAQYVAQCDIHHPETQSIVARQGDKLMGFSVLRLHDALGIDEGFALAD
jgi:hypothetical protein